MRDRNRPSRVLLVVGLGVLVVGLGSCEEDPGQSAIYLPVVGTLGVIPDEPDAIVVSAHRDGRIAMQGKGPLSLAALEEEVERQAGQKGWEQEDGSSRKVLVLEADRALPWCVTVWIVKAALSARPWPREIYFAARAEKDGAKGAIGWRLPESGQASSMVLPWTAAVLDLGDGDAHDPMRLLPVLREVQRRADDTRETRLEILAPRSGSPAVPTGFVIRVLDLALRAGVTDVCFEGRGLPLSRDCESLEWLLEKTAALRQEEGTPRIRVVGRELAPVVRTDQTVPAVGVVPHRYGLDVVVGESSPRARHRGRPGLYRAGSEAGKHALDWLAAQQSGNGSWDAGAPEHEVAATALALLAFLRHGYTNRGRHAFAKVVSKGLRFLKDRQQEDGRYTPESVPHALFGHAIATLAMAEAFEHTFSPVFKTSLQAGLDAIAVLRGPAGLWAEDSGDTTLDVWMALPIATAAATNREYRTRGREPKLVLDEAALAAIRGWVARLRARNDEPSAAIHGALIRLRALLGERRAESQSMRDALDRHGRLLPDFESEEWDIAELAHGLDAFRPVEAWRHSWSWRGVWRPVALALLKRQRWDGGVSGNHGSWDPCGGEVFGGGRVVATALAAWSLAPYGRVTWGFSGPQSRFGD